MNKEKLLAALKEMREKAKKRNFKQSVDLTINFKEMDFKKPESAFSIDVQIPHAMAKTGLKSLVFVRDKNFASQVKDKVSRLIMEDEIESLSKNKKEVESIISDFDVILAEGPVMITVGKFLGQQLAPKGKMPKPLPPNPNILQNMLNKAQSSLKVTNKKGKTLPLVHVKVGDESFSDEELAENIDAVYTAVEDKLPRKKHNIKSVYIKLSMGPPIKLVI